MNEIAEQILQETEYKGNGRISNRKSPKKGLNGKSRDPNFPRKAENGISANIDPWKMDQTLQEIDQALNKAPRPCIAFSGGSDSLVLVDLAANAGHRPLLIWVDTQMEYPGTREFIKRTAAKYHLDLRTATAQHTPHEQWRKTGWPMLGKMAARLWMQKNKGQGFKINVSECCRAMKIRPARQLTRNLGCGVQLTGQRGKADDLLRGFRAMKDGTLFYHAKDRIWIANPLTDWNDKEIQRYIQAHELEEHPDRARGAKHIGCIYCGGGSQYENSRFRILRFADSPAWRTFIINQKAGEIILALKYNTSLFLIQEAIQDTGGLETLANTRPWVFDFTRKTPLKGENK